TSLSGSPTLTLTSSIATYTPAIPPSPSSGTKNGTVSADDSRVTTNGSGWQSDTTNCSSTASKVSKKCTDPGLSLNFTFDGELLFYKQLSCPITMISTN